MTTDVDRAVDRIVLEADGLEPIRATVARAILAERERCAKIAEQSAAWDSVTAKRIAADIRRTP